jgi:hypothetical protein
MEETNVITKYLYMPGIPLLFGMTTLIGHGLLFRPDAFTQTMFGLGTYVSTLMILLLIERENTGNDEWINRESIDD